jgi:hypothetical protein
LEENDILMEDMKKENPRDRIDADASVNTRIEFEKLEEIKSERRELIRMLGSKARVFGV